MAHIKNNSVSLPTYFDFDKVLRCRGLGSSFGYAKNEMMGKRGFAALFATREVNNPSLFSSAPEQFFSLRKAS